MRISPTLAFQPAAMTTTTPLAAPHIVIVGGGFGGLAAAQELGRQGHRVTLLDKRNFQLFQPLLYQVATGLLPTGDIATPLRVVLKRFPTVTVLQSKVIDLDPVAQTLTHEHGVLAYDRLIVATGVKHSYFGNEQWRAFAPGLKTLEHALEIRRKVIGAFEQAELLDDPVARRDCLRFVVVGAGPTGVELAGAIGELAQVTMPGEFRRADPREAEVLLLEAGPAVLPAYSEKLRAKARAHLESLGVTVRLGSLVKAIDASGVTVQVEGVSQRIPATTVLWAAGVTASAFGARLAARCAAETDRAGRLRVDSECRLPGFPNIAVIGDLAALQDAKGVLVPGLAQGALQTGAYIGRRLHAELAHRKPPPPFSYRNLGSMAVIGTHRAVGDLRWVEVSGWIGWWLWALVHVMGLTAGRQRVRVFITWAWRYATRQVGDRLVTGSIPSGPAGGADARRQDP